MDPRGHANEQGERIDSKVEQRPAEYTETDDVEKNANDDHGDGSVTKVARVAPSTTTAARIQDSRSRPRRESPAEMVSSWRSQPQAGTGGAKQSDTSETARRSGRKQSCWPGITSVEVGPGCPCRSRLSANLVPFSRHPTNRT